MPTPTELIALISAEEFDIQQYAPNESGNVPDEQAKLDFLQSVADLEETEELRQAPQEIMCMVNCVIAYLSCGNTSACWLLFNNCLGNCEQA